MSRHSMDRPPHLPNCSRPPWHEAQAASQPRRLPLFRLTLHGESSPDLVQVVRTVMDLTHLCKAEATHKMWLAHHWGRAQLLIAHRERVEFYAERFQERGLRVSVEPV